MRGSPGRSTARRRGSPARTACASDLAVGKTVILMTPPCLSLLKHLIKLQGVPSNDSLVNGYSDRSAGRGGG